MHSSQGVCRIGVWRRWERSLGLVERGAFARTHRKCRQFPSRRIPAITKRTTFGAQATSPRDGVTLTSNEGGEVRGYCPRIARTPDDVASWGDEVDGVEVMGGERGLQLEGLLVCRMDARILALVQLCCWGVH